MKPQQRAIEDMSGQNANDDNPPPIAKMNHILREFRKVIPGDIPVSYIETFLIVATNEGASMGDVQRIGGTRKSTASRTLLVLWEKGLLNRVAHPSELRKLQYSLTPKGRKLVTKINELFGS